MRRVLDQRDTTSDHPHDRPDPRKYLINNIAAAGTCTTPKLVMNASHLGSVNPGIHKLTAPQPHPTKIRSIHRGFSFEEPQNSSRFAPAAIPRGPDACCAGRRLR
jgi:hypothetical protein